MIVVEVGFWFEMDCETPAEAQAIVNDLRIKNPDTQETVAPQWVRAWEKVLAEGDDDRN